MPGSIFDFSNNINKIGVIYRVAGIITRRFLIKYTCKNSFDTRLGLPKIEITDSNNIIKD